MASLTAPTNTLADQPSADENSGLADNSQVFAVVTHCEGDRVTVRPLHSDTEITIDRILHQVPALLVNDEVLVLTTSGTHTITGRLRRDNESAWPITADAEGNLKIDAGRSVTLQTPKGTLTIDQTGTISLNGRNVVTEAAATNRILGGLVSIN